MKSHSRFGLGIQCSANVGFTTVVVSLLAMPKKNLKKEEFIKKKFGKQIKVTTIIWPVFF